MNKPRVPSNPSVTRLLSSGLAVPEALHTNLWERAKISIPQLAHRAVYKSPAVFGRDFWSVLSRHHRILAGKVLAHWVTTGQVPLEFASCRYCQHKRYRRI